MYKYKFYLFVYFGLPFRDTKRLFLKLFIFFPCRNSKHKETRLKKRKCANDLKKIMIKIRWVNTFHVSIWPAIEYLEKFKEELVYVMS